MTEVLDSRVLVLNKNYVPVNVITVRKALKKLINLKAEIVSVENEAFVGYSLDSWAEFSSLKREYDDMDDCDEMIGSEGFSIIAPTIIRALSYDKTFRQSIKLSRKNIFIRDGNICQFCGKKLPTEKLTLDHVLPRAQGGVNSWENLVCSCYKCNSRKGCQTPEQAKMKLLRKPVKPTTFTTFEVPKDSKKYKNWDSFISHMYWSTELKE